MRSVKQVEAAIDELKLKIEKVLKFRTIATFAGSEQLLALFNEQREYYERGLAALDEASPALNREYAKTRACLGLIRGFIKDMTTSEATLDALKKQFLDLNGELQNAMDEQVRREKRAM